MGAFSTRTGSLLVSAMIAFGSGPALADFTSAIQYTGGITSPTGADVSAGFSFTTNESITIDALADFSPLVGGSDVRLYDEAGNVLASAMVSSSDPTDGTFKFHQITAVTLAASTTYYIAADVVNGQLAEYSVTGLTTDPGISFGAAVEAYNLGQNPTSDLQGGAFNPGYFGPSFEIRPAVVPEPATVVMLGLGTLVVLGCGRSRRKSARSLPSEGSPIG